MMKKKRSLRISVTALFIPLLVHLAFSEFSKEQKYLLEKIKVAGEEAGLPLSELKAIEKLEPNVCYDEDCLNAALDILSKINLRTNPCENGKWIEFVCRPEEEGTLSQMSRLIRRVSNQTLELLTGDAFENSTDFLLPEARKYYRQCVNKGESDRDDVRYILQVTKKYGGWPMFTHRQPNSSFPWVEMVIDAHRLDRNDFGPLFLQVLVSGSVPPMSLEIGKVPFPHTVQSVGDYKKLLIGMQRVGGLKEPVNTTQIGETLKFVSEFNEKIISFTGLLDDSHVKEVMTPSQLQSKTDEYCLQKGVSWKMDWKHFFEGVLAGTGIHLNESSPNISVSFQSVMELISLVEAEMRSNETRGRISIVNALYLNVAIMLVQESTTLADNLKTFRCSEASGERKELCFEKTKEIFGYSLSKSYLNAYYKDTLTLQIIDMMDTIKERYLQLIDGLEWMQNCTKEHVSDKIKSLKLYAIQPDWMKESGELEKFYGDFPSSVMSAGDSLYPQNFLAVNNWEVAKKVAWVCRMVSLSSLLDVDIYEGEAWNVYLGTTTGEHHRRRNAIQLNAGLFQKPFYSPDMPGFMVYGGLGSILGHEVGHGLDPQARKYDKNGKPGEFWDSTSLERCNMWVAEIAKFYHSIPHQITNSLTTQVDPMGATINEDVSDILGLSVSFHAYSKYLEELEESGGKEKVLPGLSSFSPQKLFFIKWGIMWCNNRADVQTKFEDLADPHSSGNRRASLPLLRLKQFHEAFGCNMNSTGNNNNIASNQPFRNFSLFESI